MLGSDQGPRGMHVLAVDDEASVLRGLEVVLRRANRVSSVATAADLVGAAARVRERMPDLIVLDVVLHTDSDAVVSLEEYRAAVKERPEHNTFAFHAWLRMRPDAERTHVILYTARVFMEDVIPLLRDGHTFYLRKTTGFGDLLHFVDAALAGEALDAGWEIGGHH